MCHVEANWSISDFSSLEASKLNYVQGINYKQLCIQYIYIYGILYLLTYSVGLVRERTIPTEQPPLVGEVNIDF
jgi:hypothetical protein